MYYLCSFFIIVICSICNPSLDTVSKNNYYQVNENIKINFGENVGKKAIKETRNVAISTHKLILQ